MLKLNNLQELYELINNGKKYIIINNNILNIKEYIVNHPGGDNVLIDSIGKDVTNEYNDIGHSKSANNILDTLKVGIINLNNKKQNISENKYYNIYLQIYKLKYYIKVLFNSIYNKILIIKYKYFSNKLFQKNIKNNFIIKEKHKINNELIKITIQNNTKRFFNISILKHIKIYNDKNEFRYYTPIKICKNSNSIELFIKIYENGKITKYLNNLSINDTIKVSGIYGIYNYSNDIIYQNNKPIYLLLSTNIYIICAGTGITPFIRLLNHNNMINRKINIFNINKNNNYIYFNEILNKFNNINYFTENKKFSVNELDNFINSYTYKDLVLYCGPDELGNDIEKYFNNKSIYNFYKL